jgi:hypothetical protein
VPGCHYGIRAKFGLLSFISLEFVGEFGLLCFEYKREVEFKEIINIESSSTFNTNNLMVGM